MCPKIAEVPPLTCPFVTPILPPLLKVRSQEQGTGSLSAPWRRDEVSAGFPGCSAQQTSKDGPEPALWCNGDVVFVWAVSGHVLQAGVANKSQCSLEGNPAGKQGTRKDLNISFPPQLLCSQLAAIPSCCKRAKQ